MEWKLKKLENWQKDLLYSQLEFGKLCEKHQSILEKLYL